MKMHVMQRRRSPTVTLAVFAVAVALGLLSGGDDGAASGLGSAGSTSGGASGVQRLLYTSDWSGTSHTYAFDPTGRLPAGQVTFGSPRCVVDGRACVFGGVAPSPDGRWLLFQDYPCGKGLYIARADGSQRRRLAWRVEECPHESYDISWSSDSRRIAYQISAPAGPDGQIRVVDVDGSNNAAVSFGRYPKWSPKGDVLAFLQNVPVAGGGSVDQLVVSRLGVERALAKGRSLSFAWSPDGKWLTYGAGGLFVVHPDGTGRRKLSGDDTSGESWSADSRFVSFSTGFSDDVVKLVELASGEIRIVDERKGRHDVDWSPRGHVLAIGSEERLSVLDAATGTSRVVVHEPTYAVAWAPDGRSLAYTVRLGDELFGWYQRGDVRVSDLAGRTRIVVAVRGPYGGGVGLTWTKPPAGTRYSPPRPRTIATVTPDGLTALWPIDHIAADGDRVAYSACGHAFVWTPATRAVVQADPSNSLTSRCTSYGYYAYTFYGLAIAGDRLAYGARDPSANGPRWEVVTQSLSPSDRVRTVGSGAPGAGSEVDKGEPVGSGELLIFSSWECERGYCPQYRSSTVTKQSIWRIREPRFQGECPTVSRGVAAGPCQRLLTQPGPIVPFDIEGRRVVAEGTNETWVLDGDGRLVRAVAVSSLAAQLSGDDLVLLRRGELGHYRVSSGALVHSWPLPNVPSGRECGYYRTAACPYAKPALVLEDAARGRVTYTLGDEVHVLRLSDGNDVAVAQGTLARFVDTGLVVASGAKLRLIRDDVLP